MKTDYKVGDWVEVLPYNDDYAPIEVGKKYKILELCCDYAVVDDPHGKARWMLQYKNIKPFAKLYTQTTLSKAEAIISGQRQTVNGKPERSFEQIAARWSLTVGTTITAQQVALMMVDMKMVRALQGVTTEGHDDHFVDMAGYVALAAELGDK